MTRPIGIDQWSLSPSFQEQLTSDGFQEIGCHYIRGNDYFIELDLLTVNWKFVIYAFVSFADGGKYIRIGKVEETGLRSRLSPRYVRDALHLKNDVGWVRARMARWAYSPSDASAETLSMYGQFAGSTPPIIIHESNGL